jgi:hypothetical protein
MVAPLKASDGPPLAASSVPPQVMSAFTVVALTSVAG